MIPIRDRIHGLNVFGPDPCLLLLTDTTLTAIPFITGHNGAVIIETPFRIGNSASGFQHFHSRHFCYAIAASTGANHCFYDFPTLTFA